MKLPKIKDLQGIAKYFSDATGISTLVTGISALVKNNIDILKFVFQAGAENKQEKIDIVENNEPRQTLLTTLNTKSEYFYQSNQDYIFVNSETGDLSEKNAARAITYREFIEEKAEAVAKSMEEKRGGRPQFARDSGKREESDFARSTHALLKRFGAESVASGVGTIEKDIEESLDSEVKKLERILEISKERVLDNLRKKLPGQDAENIWGQLEAHVQNRKVYSDGPAKVSADELKVGEIITETLTGDVRDLRMKQTVSACLEEVEKQIDLKQELAKAKKEPKGTVIYFPPKDRRRSSSRTY